MATEVVVVVVEVVVGEVGEREGGGEGRHGTQDARASGCA